VLPQKVKTYLSDEILLEYVAVLNREKFAKYVNFKTRADIVLSKIREISTFYKPDRKVEVLRDSSDNKFLELAAVSSADFLITGNTLDFQIAEFDCTRIVSPREYWGNFHPRN
jgi:putative PIN family toxin of toxin-antitoxin system